MGYVAAALAEYEKALIIVHTRAGVKVAPSRSMKFGLKRKLIHGDPVHRGAKLFGAERSTTHREHQRTA